MSDLNCEKCGSPATAICRGERASCMGCLPIFVAELLERPVAEVREEMIRAAEAVIDAPEFAAEPINDEEVLPIGYKSWLDWFFAPGAPVAGHLSQDILIRHSAKARAELSAMRKQINFLRTKRDGSDLTIKLPQIVHESIEVWIDGRLYHASYAAGFQGKRLGGTA